MSDEPSASERFEQDAEAFYRDTGVMAPGKDAPAAMGGYIDRDLRLKLWMLWGDRERLRAEVERLSKTAEMQSTWIHENCGSSLEGVWITDEQIDKAWANRHGRCETRPGGYYGSVVTLDAEDLGIVECPECDGSGVFTHSDDVVSVSQSCPRCHGHGWIREERGDE